MYHLVLKENHDSSHVMWRERAHCGKGQILPLKPWQLPLQHFGLRGGGGAATLAAIRFGAAICAATCAAIFQLIFCYFEAPFLLCS